MGRAVRTAHHRYVEWQRADGRIAARELYDHRTDPGETFNLAGSAQMAEVVDRLHETLRSGWRAAVPQTVRPPGLGGAISRGTVR